MKVPLSWLKEYVDVDLPPRELAHRMTMAGTETESVTEIGADWERVVIVQVLDLSRHPNADNLFIAEVDRGDGRSTIVTGAPNLSVGAKVPLVMPGGRLPPSRHWPNGAEITARKLRGIMSEGMLCAGDELHISDDHNGIYILEDDAPVGDELRRFAGDVVFDFYITPNRPDCMNVVGLAREIHALTGAPIRPFRWAMPRGDRPASDFCRIEVADPDLAPRYTATVIRDLQIRPSPQWMQRRLFLSGVRPISNVVDITNYVMLEAGQPMHAFDGGKLDRGIVVRRARPGEHITTLDGQDRALEAEMLVIADQRVPVGVAGVMGGANTEIGSETRVVVLESANFNPLSIRRTSRDLGLKTEASRRFERGLDPGYTLPCAARATQLMVELADGTPAEGALDVYPVPEQQRRISLRLDDLAGLLGKRYERGEVVEVLERLHFEVSGDDPLEVAVPGDRRDVERKADLIEEVARISGYDAIPEVIFEGRVPQPKLDRARLLEERAKLALVAAGCQEVITYSLVDPYQSDKLDLRAPWPPPMVDGRRRPPTNPLQRVWNPMSEEQSVLRQTLLGSLLDVVWSNLRNRERVWCFELARVYLPPLDPLPREPRRLAIALTGDREMRSWRGPAEPADFFDLKGVIELLLERLGLPGGTYRPAEHPSLQPGRAAELVVGPSGEPRVLGTLGQLDPRIAERFDLGGRAVLLAELDFDALSELSIDALTSTTLPEYPALKLDLAFNLDEAVPQDQVLVEIRQAGGELLESVELFDVYRGSSIPEGQKSLAYALAFRAPDRTLRDEDVATTIEAIEVRLGERLGARIRGGIGRP